MLRYAIRREDRIVEQILHLNLHVEDEIAAMEELPHRLFGVEFARNVDANLLCYLLHLLYPSVLYQSIAAWSTEQARIATRGDRQRVFIVLENQANDTVDSIDGFVDFMGLQHALLFVLPLVEDLHSRL